MFTENETNQQRIFGRPNPSPYVKDAFHEYVIHNQTAAINPARLGTKAAAHYQRQIPPGETAVFRVRLAGGNPGSVTDLSNSAFDTMVTDRHGEADAFYASITPSGMDEDRRRVMRQALAGMLWSNSTIFFDIDRWLHERGDQPAGPTRNSHWGHMLNDDILARPNRSRSRGQKIRYRSRARPTAERAGQAREPRARPGPGDGARPCPPRGSA